MRGPQAPAHAPHSRFNQDEDLSSTGRMGDPVRLPGARGGIDAVAMGVLHKYLVENFGALVTGALLTTTDGAGSTTRFLHCREHGHDHVARCGTDRWRLGLGGNAHIVGVLRTE